ncbi:hypothetical protein E4T56_gene2878 [Termitomyces sp. T112]|nr:hypothetical protein E4T56_gene2878 [Termitomyces sp. T112]
MFQAKPITFQLESSQVAFAASYLQAHLSSHSSTTLLLRITLPFSDNSIPTLVDSSTTDNFIDKFLAVLASQCLQHLPTPILLKLFNSDTTPARDITHCLEVTMTFANGQQQKLQLLIMKLHSSAPIILGFSWLCSTNPCIDWPSLTLHLDQDNLTNSRLVPFDISPPSKNSETTIDQPQTPLQLCLKSAWLFVNNVQLDNSPKVLPANSLTEALP